ncbi:MAG TPA: PIN domain-containing protein [Actinomycetota bacterium]
MALIVDTSVLYAAIHDRDRDHARCAALIGESDELLVLPSPILPEVDYLVAREGRPEATVRLLGDVEDGSFLVEDLEYEDYARIASLLKTYGDLDVGFVDAAVLAIVERLGERKLATLDHRHFGAMRPRHVEALELLPS